MDKERPLVSVVTPTNNIVKNNKIEDFKLQVSLLKLQTYPNIEHVVIDNASDDGTVDLLKEYEKSGLIKLISQKDSGKYEAFNRGIEYSEGKYISFLSCDDFYHDITAVFDIVNVMESDNIDYIYAPSYCRHQKGFTFFYVPSWYNGFQVMPCPHQAMFFKRSVLINEGMFDTDFKIMSDFDLIIRIMLKKYNGTFFNKNYLTMKSGEQVYNHPELEVEEAKSIFYKNYDKLCRLDEDILNKMVLNSEFPKELLDKLVQKFPQEDRDLFYKKCEQLNQLRMDINQRSEANANT